MREIKFRVWHKNSKEYLQLGNSDWDAYREASIEISFYPSLKVIQRVFSELDSDFTKDVVIEQYTGLKDKNGKEIYEGDILSQDGVTDPEDIFEVVYHDAEARFVLENDYGRGPDLGEWFNKLVIGNIHENKDLL